MQTFITYGTPRWSLGVLVGGPAFVLVIAVLVTGGVWLLRRQWDDYDRGMAHFFGWGLVGVAVIVAIFAGVGFYPYSAQYHQWTPTSGVVATTNSRFLGDGNGGTSQKFVVTFKGSGQQYGCNDTRCASVKPGDSLTITCIRSFQWFGTPGYDCNFVSMKAGS